MKNYLCVSFGLSLLFSPLAFLAQSAPAASAARNSASADQESTLVLSPFEVSTGKDQGYAASNTLSGTRLNSSLANIPASIQVLTKELILDLNVTDYEVGFRFWSAVTGWEVLGPVQGLHGWLGYLGTRNPRKHEMILIHTDHAPVQTSSRRWAR
jgi:hypothetical protein